MNIQELLLEAYKNPNGEIHKKIMEYSKILFGLKDGSLEEFQYAKELRKNMWPAQQELYNNNVIFDLGICDLSFNNTKIYASSDSVSETNTFLFGFYDELNYLKTIEKLLQEDDCVIDVGNNIGCHSIPYSTIVENGTVYCFEPCELANDRFIKNCELNDVKNIELFKELLSDKEEDLPFNIDEQNFNKGVGRVDYNSSNFEHAKTLDSFLNELEGNIRLLKIDVEGHELNVLKGAQKLLKKYKPYIFIEYNREKWKVAELKKVIPYEFSIQKLPYYFYEKPIQIFSDDDPEGFVNFLISPK